jgi:SAM-dependent methyltransferase
LRRTPAPGDVASSLVADFRSTFTRTLPYRFVGELRACELCGGDRHEVVGRRDRYGNRLRTVLCRGCGLVFTNPMPTDEEVDRFYERHYRNLYHGAYAPTPKAILKARRGALARYEDLRRFLPATGRVIDVGAGSGDFVHVLRSNGIAAEGIEPNRAFAAYARRTYRAPIHAGGWQDVSIPPESVDLVTANHVLEHFRNPLAALWRMHSWLKTGGLLYVAVPDIENPDRTPYGRFHVAHLYNFNRASLVMMALRAGFAIDPASGRSTDLMLRKAPQPASDWLIFPDNHERLARFFSRFTNRRYFLSPTPYRRWVRRMARLGGVMAAAQFRALPDAGTAGVAQGAAVDDERKRG